MSNFQPVWQITIGGTNYTQFILSNLSIASGRTNIYEQAWAGYCNIEMINLTQSQVAIELNDPITISLKDSTNTFVPIFGGNVKDLTISVATASTVALTQSIQILALGALSRLPRSLTNGVLVQDYDGNQIRSVLEPILLNSWNEVPAALTWATYPATETWATAQNIGLGEIDTGNYELAARSSERTNAYLLISNLATSGLGYIYENALGQICYADSTHRSIYLSTYGYTDFSGNKAMAYGVSVKTSIGDIRNEITLKYGANSTSETTSSDATSISNYGYAAEIITTTIKHTVDAESQANFYLTLRKQPQANFNEITFELTNPELTNTERDNLINVAMGLPIRVSDLPLNMVAGQFVGFIEGWKWQAAFNQISLSITASPLAYSLQAMAWEDVPIAETWSSLSASLEWQDATIVS